MAIYFHRKDIDIREILSGLKIFNLISGLTININKCVIIPMGNNLANQYENIENIRMENQAKIVGIVFRNDRSASEISVNWEGRITKIKQTRKSWNSLDKNGYQ